MSLNAAGPIIYLITKGEATISNFGRTSPEILDIVRFAVSRNVSLIQIREKALSARLLFELALEAAAITRESATQLMVNDRADIALAAGADGVHLTANSLPPSVIRQNLPSKFVIGVSTHSPIEVRTAAESGADFAVYGPVFETAGKEKPCGISGFHLAVESVNSFRVIGLGGIDESNCRSVVDAGASGIAAIRSLNDPESLDRIIETLKTG